MKKYLQESYEKYFQIKKNAETIINDHVAKSNKDVVINCYVNLMSLAVASGHFNSEVKELIIASINESNAYCEMYRGYKVSDWTNEKQDAYFAICKQLTEIFKSDLETWLK